MSEPIVTPLGIVGIKNRGEYNAATNYEKLNVVTYQGSSYCAKGNTIGNLPTNTNYWYLLAQKGDKGDTGNTGATGPAPVRGVDYWTAEDIAGIKNDITEEVSDQLGDLTTTTPLAASSMADMTDTDRIYVLTTDGHWYWYDGANWQDGGVYQAAEDSDTVNKIIETINNGILTKKSENIFDLDFTLYAMLTAASGEFIINPSQYPHHVATEKYLEIKESTYYNFYCLEAVGTNIEKRVYFYDVNKDVIAMGNLNYVEFGQNMIVTSPVGAKYLRIACKHTSLTPEEVYDKVQKIMIVEDKDSRDEYVYPKLVETRDIDYDFDALDKNINKILSKDTVNIFNDEFIPTATYSNTTGRYVSPDGIRPNSVHKKFIPVSPGEKYVFSNPDSMGVGVNKTAYFYNSNKEYVSNSVIAMGTAFTIPSNCYYVRFLLAHTNQPATDLANMPYWMLEHGETSHWYIPPKMIETDIIDYDFAALENLKETVNDLEEEIEGYSGKNIEEPTLINGITTAVTLNSSNKYINIGYFTDTHENANNAAKSISFMNKLSLSNVCNMCIHGGDMITSYSMNFNQFLAEMLKRINNYKQMRNLYFVKGNHDNNHSSTAEYNLTKTEYNMMFNINLKDAIVNDNDPYGNYYYVDDKINKVRVIVLDSYYLYSDYSNVNFGTEQTSWLYTKALDVTQLQDYTVVIFSHYYTRSCEIVDILKAFNDKGTTYGSYTFDGSSNAKFVGLIHGHDHYDSYSNADGYNVIGVTKAFSDAGDIGTNNETAIDIFTIDTDNNILYETRIGKGSSRSYRFGASSSRIS